MQCWLSGACALETDAALARACSMHFSVSRPSVRTRSAHVHGSIHVASLAEHATIEGTLSLSGARMRYGLRFDDDQGRIVELVGEQELTLRRPPRGFSVVSGELRAGGRRIGQVRLRLDPRDGMKELFRWA